MSERSIFRRPLLANRSLIPLGLLALCALSFGPLILTLGLYWDDWPSLWFLHFFGPGVFPLAFAADRPVQGWLFVLTTGLVGESLLAWQIFGIVTRWLSGIAMGWMLVSLWPERKTQVLWVTVLFLLYPGFMQQYIPITYGHQFLIMSLFFFSVGLMIWSVCKPAWYRPLTLGSLLSALLTMFALEYFYGLELLRPVFLWLLLAGQTPDLPQRLWLTAKRWLPYAFVDVLFLVWRLTHTTPRGEVTLFKNLALAPIATLAELVKTILSDIYESALVAWGRIFAYLNISGQKLNLVLAYAAVTVLAALGAFLLLRLAQKTLVDGPASGEPASPGRMPGRMLWGLQALLVGIYALLIAGWPVWVTDLRLELSVPWDRFTQPLMLGACLALVGLLDWLVRPHLPKIILVSLLAGLAAGAQLHYAFAYRLEWAAQKEFFWQLAWRIPALQPGTLLLSSGLPFFITTDNSLTAPLNWIYAPELGSKQMPYLMYDLSARLGNRLPALSPGIPIYQEYRATEFNGSTSQALVFYYNPPRCLKVLDYNIDRLYPNKPDIIVQAMPLSRLDLVQPGAPSSPKMPALFGPEPAHDWCYYFEKIELAVQMKQWNQAARLADEALKGKPELTRDNAAELLPLVTGYVQAGRYDKAIELSLLAGKLSDKLAYAICDRWYQLGQPTGDNPGFQSSEDFRSANEQVNQKFQCPAQSTP